MPRCIDRAGGAVNLSGRVGIMPDVVGLGERLVELAATVTGGS
jgi:hypothetical protein